MNSDSRAICTFGWSTASEIPHTEAISVFGWVDTSPAPQEASGMSPNSLIKPGEQDPMDIRRAFQDLNHILERRYSIHTDILPSSGQGQGEISLHMGVNVISTNVVANDDSATLPPAEANGFCKVINPSAKRVQIFPDTDHKIDNGAANASVTVAAGAVAVFEAIDDENWYRMEA